MRAETISYREQKVGRHRDRLVTFWVDRMSNPQLFCDDHCFRNLQQWELFSNVADMIRPFHLKEEEIFPPAEKMMHALCFPTVNPIGESMTSEVTNANPRLIIL